MFIWVWFYGGRGYTLKKLFLFFRSPRKPLASPLKPVTTESNLVFGFDAPPLTATAYTSADFRRDHTPSFPITVGGTLNGGGGMCTQEVNTKRQLMVCAILN